MNTKEKLNRQRKQLVDLVPAFETLNTKRSNIVAPDYVTESLYRARNELLDYMSKVACQYILTSIGVRISRKRTSELQKEFQEANYHFDIEGPFEKLPQKIQHLVLHGSGHEKIEFQYMNDRGDTIVRHHPFE